MAVILGIVVGIVIPGRDVVRINTACSDTRVSLPGNVFREARLCVFYYLGMLPDRQWHIHTTRNQSMY